ncbi:MAG: methionyl-tRNA formyltransferase [Acidimicrobiales bacterium]
MPDRIQRVAFLGTPEIAVPTLHALDRAGYEIPMVVSGADKRRGRGSSTTPTPVKAAALELGVPVVTTVDELLEAHRAEPVDLAVVVAFGQIIRPNVLAEIPMINLHFSPLPRWRGAAPIERAILAGDVETAVEVITVAEGLDEGDVWAHVPVTIHGADTAGTLWARMSVTGADLVVETISAMNHGTATAVPQTGEVTYAHKISTDDRRLDWELRADELHRVVRVGGAWTTFRGDRFKIHEAEPIDDPFAPSSNLSPGEVYHGVKGVVFGTADGGLRPVLVQPAGKPAMDADDWANGARPDGSVLGD